MSLSILYITWIDKSAPKLLLSLIMLSGSLSKVVFSAAERKGTPVLLSASVSDNFGNSPQMAAPRRSHEIDQSTQCFHVGWFHVGWQ